MYTKKSGGGGGGVEFFIFFLNSFSFHILCYFQNIKNIEKFPFTYWLNGRWFLQIVDRDSWNLYPLYPLFPCSDFVSQMWGWFGGRGCNVFLTFYAISNIYRKTNLGIQNNYFSFNVFFVVFNSARIFRSTELMSLPVCRRRRCCRCRCRVFFNRLLLNNRSGYGLHFWCGHQMWWPNTCLTFFSKIGLSVLI